VFIAGNHDFVLERVTKGNNDDFKIKWPENVHYLYQSGIEIDGVKIFGTPWSLIFGNFVFMQDERMLNNYFSQIPEGLDILLSHSPAYRFNDKISGENLGSKSLRDNIKRAMPKKVLVGHIHTGSHSVERLCLDPFEGKFIDSINVSLVDDEYNVSYPVYRHTVEK
jgi:Icc-related predicted phosphoesterase